MRTEYFIYEEGRMQRVEFDYYLEHWQSLKHQFPEELELSCRNFGACVIEFLYYCDELEQMCVSYKCALDDSPEVHNERV